MMSIRISRSATKGRHNRSGPPGDPVDRIPRWRRLLAATAAAALSLTGVGLLGFAPASAEEAAPVVCVEPQVLDTDGLTCVDPVVEEVVEPVVCVEPQVLDTDGLTCVDPVVEEVVEPVVCVEPQVLDTDGLTCVDPAEEQASALKVEEIVQVQPQGKIAFCHRTAADGNPYVPIETNLNAFYNAGHISHTGPVWPAVGPDGKWGDIYPPNIYDADGQNWGPGAEEFVENGCSSEPSDNPGIAIDAESCSFYDGYGWAEFWATNTDSDFFYELLLDDVIVDSGWGDEEIGYSSQLEPGTYVVTVKMYDGDPEKEGELVSEVSADFTLDPCPELDISATPLTCSTGTNGTATLHFTGLIEGEYYEWWVEGSGGSDHGSGDFVATGPTYDQNLSGLPPGSYTAWVTWEWVPSITEKESIIIEERYSITDETTFTIVACPALASTGVDNIPVYVNLALLLTILGGVALAVMHQRRGEPAFEVSSMR
jgi:hypothetical protein